MLLVAILIAWSLVVVLVVAICLMAAQGDSLRREQLDEAEVSELLPAAAERMSFDPLPSETLTEVHPLELLLQDQRKGARPLTDRVAR